MRIGLIAVGLSALIVMETETPSSTKTSGPDRFDQLVVDVSISSDTLEAADRIEIHHLQHEASVQPISPAELTPPDMTTLVSGDSSTVNLGAKNKKDGVRRLKRKPKYIDSDKPRPKRTNSNKASKTEQSKAVVGIKPCRPKALDGLLQAFNLSSRCQT
jgi:hypothetical protein